MANFTPEGHSTQLSPMADRQSCSMLAPHYIRVASGCGATGLLTTAFLHCYPLLLFSHLLLLSLLLSICPHPPFFPTFSPCMLAAANFYPAYLATQPNTSSPTPRPASCFSPILISSPQSESIPLPIAWEIPRAGVLTARAPPELGKSNL